MSDRFRKTIRVDEQRGDDPRRRDEPLVGFIDRDGNPDDGLDLTKPVGYDKFGLPLYALRRFTKRLPW